MSTYATLLKEKWDKLCERGLRHGHFYFIEMVPREYSIDNYRWRRPDAYNSLRLTSSSIIDDESIDEEISHLEKIYAEVQSFLSADVHCQEYIHTQFCHDVWHGEVLSFAKEGDSEEAIIAFEEGNRSKMTCFLRQSGMDDEKASRTIKKMENIKSALRFLVGVEAPVLSIDLIKTLHAHLMKDLLDAPGEFRQISVEPSGSTMKFAPFRTIAPRLIELINFTSKFAKKDRVDRECILLMAFFFSEFLLIHPFVNGNGRLARLLLCLFLPPPFMPCSFNGRFRVLYLECLEDRGTHKAPVKLASYMLKELVRTLNNLHFTLLPAS